MVLPLWWYYVVILRIIHKVAVQDCDVLAFSFPYAFFVRLLYLLRYDKLY